MSDNKRFFLPIFASILVIIGFGMGYILHPKVDSKRASKFEEVLDALDEMYVDSIDKDKVFNQAINDMLHKLDPHSRYITANALRSEQESMQGSFGGIGVRFQLIKDTVCVIKAIPNAPAFFSGVRSGDQIIAINGKSFTGKKITTDKVMASLKGDVDTEVKVTILRNNTKKHITIIRGEIPLETVSTYYMIDKEIGFLRIDQFSVPTHEEFVVAAESLLSQGMNKLVLDLRGNPGGVMEAAINIADEFLAKGDVIVSTKSKNSDADISKSTEGGCLERVKLVVLIDEGTASAAEILAGAIQDNDRGELVGRRTYGKGLVQQDQMLSDGSSVRMTISRYYMPSGRSIQRKYTGDYEAYMRDEARYIKGELFSQDSMYLDKSKVYKTKKGRRVYGGGGVIPDEFVPLDTTGSSLYLSELNVNQIFSAFVFKSLQTKRTKWKTVENLRDYNFTSVDLNAFTEFASSTYNIRGYERLNKTQTLRINQQLKLEFARQLWEEIGVYKVTSIDDKELKRALLKLR